MNWTPKQEEQKHREDPHSEEEGEERLNRAVVFARTSHHEPATVERPEPSSGSRSGLRRANVRARRRLKEDRHITPGETREAGEPARA